MEPFEYAIKKDIRNNPIIREVDRARQREFWHSGGVGVVLVAALLFSAWRHFEWLQHGYRVDVVQRERAAEEETRRQLRLEYESLRSPRRIESLATGRLRLVTPDAADAVVLERVRSSAPPDQSVVARK
jgi:cell division protein FtsL